MNAMITAPETTSRPLRVLIVDDSEADVIMYRRMLAGRFGTEIFVCEADTGGEALERAEQVDFDVALVDYRLPDMDGLEILSRLALVKPNLPTIFLTGQGSEVVAAQAIKRGAHDYLVKRDLNAESLGAVICQAIQSNAGGSYDAQLVHRLKQTNQELDHAVRSLSHDMSANFMMLESSFQQIKNSCGQTAGSGLMHGVTHVEACLRESKRFLDDMQLLTRTGSMAVEPARVEMSIVVQTVLFELESLLAEHNIAVEVEEPLPRVWCNETRASQVISNLVRNAIKHGCDPLSGKICISSPSSAARPLPPGFAWLRIHDNGRGIPAASRDEIFLPGRRLKTAHPDGSGMGLAIVKKIIERAGGSIFVDPSASSGTAFVFSLPLPRAT